MFCGREQLWYNIFFFKGGINSSAQNGDLTALYLYAGNILRKSKFCRELDILGGLILFFFSPILFLSLVWMTIVEFISERNFLCEYSVVVQGGNKVTTPKHWHSSYTSLL